MKKRPHLTSWWARPWWAARATVLAEPGDILFFPEHTWHEVHNIEDGPGLMCGLRSQYPTRKIFNELLRPKGMSPSLAWHKFSSLIPLKFHAANQDRPEFKVD